MKVGMGRHFQSMSEFSFLKDIGVGSFGTVKLAVHGETNRHYAVKTIQLTSQISPHEIDILQRQINIHSQVDHPHLIKLWDSIQEHNRIYMVMELAENNTLFSYQNKHSLIPQFDAFRFFSQTLSALKHLHKMDIMHRDLKPQNILLDNHMNVKLCDLGWATDKIHHKRKTFCGTYEYMAPEMVFEKEYDYRIDVWALGVLLYQLVHGRAPFPANTLQEIKKCVSEGSYELAQDISQDLKLLIVDILQFNPQKRPSLQQIMKYPWCERMKREVIRNTMRSMDEQKSKEKEREKHTLAGSKKHKKLNSLLCEENINGKPTIKPIELYNSMTSEKAMLYDKSNLNEIKNKRKIKNKCKTQGEGSMEKLFTDFSKDILSRKPIQENFFRQEELESYRYLYEKQAKKMRKPSEKVSEVPLKYIDRRKNKTKGIKQNDII